MSGFTDWWDSWVQLGPLAEATLGDSAQAAWDAGYAAGQSGSVRESSMEDRAKAAFGPDAPYVNPMRHRNPVDTTDPEVHAALLARLESDPTGHVEDADLGEVYKALDKLTARLAMLDAKWENANRRIDMRRDEIDKSEAKIKQLSDRINARHVEIESLGRRLDERIGAAGKHAQGDNNLLVLKIHEMVLESERRLRRNV